MAKGSQLTQLKSALSEAGLSRQPSAGKKRKRSLSSTERDKDKKAQKLQEIRQKLNPFDVKVTKLKHDVGGRKLKGVTGKPGESKQAGLEQRKKTLLKEYRMKDHTGGIIDRRFGENDPSMTPEERMLERFTKERQRSSKGAAFNLEDEDELTHYGQSLSKLDDFEGTGLGLDGDGDEESDGKIDSQTVKHAHFGGFDAEEEEDADGEPVQKKSKAEVMAEVIAKSKQHKYERQLQRQQDADTRHQLDEQLDDIRSLLFASNAPDAVTEKLVTDSKNNDLGYDQHVRELALDKRARPKDRTKTEEELAVEAKEALEKAERKRQKRMLGEPDDSTDDERGPTNRGSRKDKGGDDLEDDFIDEDEFPGLGAGLEGDLFGENSGGRREEINGLGGTEASDDEDEDEDEGRDEASEDEEAESVPLKFDKKELKRSPNKIGPTSNELPYTFPCPETHDDLLEIVEGVAIEKVPTVIQRIRTLYHPSLGPDNKYKLQALTGVLIDYILHVTAPPIPEFSLLPPLLPHIHALTSSYPIESANQFIVKLNLMHKNLQKGLAKGATSLSSKTWPSSSELALLWLISYVWPTSDMNHPVVTPARLLMGSYLGLGRIRSIQDISSGTFLCTLVLQFEEHSKRLFPEVLNFLLNTVLHISPHRFKNKSALPGDFPLPDFNASRCCSLKVKRKAAGSLEPRPIDIKEALFHHVSDSEEIKVDLLFATFDLLGRAADMYKGLDGFIELFEPAHNILDALTMTRAPEALKSKHARTSEMLAKLLKFAKMSRQPLALQAHKPIPIATYIPKFESSGSSGYMRHDDPDRERAAASKLRYEYKQERKGAIRELRKDARFMSAVKQKEQQEKDKRYTDRMNKVFSSLESERAEQKRMEREKQKEKRRSGRK